MPSYRPKCLTCERSRKSSQLMCPRCWTHVPADLQTTIYRTWTRGSIRQGDDWTAAVQRAQALVQAALAPTPDDEPEAPYADDPESLDRARTIEGRQP